MIFIVEDDDEIRGMEVYALESSGFKVAAFDCGKSMDEELKNAKPELIILDIMLPGEDGLAILRRLRLQDSTKKIPIMMLTAKGTELDKVKGLDLGADDYMTKPFGILEFISRVKALIRRASNNVVENTDVIKMGSVTLNDSRHEVLVDDNICELSYKEFELLKMLMSKPGRAYSRREILEQVWGIYGDSDNFIETRTVDVHVKTLRQKLGEGGNIIHTVRNVGYKGEA